MGTPAVGMMTSNFVSAAELTAKVLGMPGYAFAIIDHPVSSASDVELKAKALQTMAAIDELVLV